MRKCCFILFILAIYCKVVFAQSDTLTTSEQATLDSLIDNDPFLQLLKDAKNKNTVYISIGAGNGGFTSHNNAANATGYVKQVILMPAVNFISANGFTAGITGFATNDTINSVDLYQLGISAGYGYQGKKIDAGLSYTRYLRTGTEYNSRNIYQNDFYGYLKKSKGWLRPGISAGYVNGKYKEWSWLKYQRTVHLPLPLPNGRDTIIISRVKDSMSNTTSYFSVTAEVHHEFSFYEVFSGKDAIGFTPSLMVNFASSGLSQTHTSAIFDRYRILSRYKKAELSDNFKVQSVALSLDGIFTLDHFFLQPNFYFDYFIPSTQEKRFSTIFSVAAGVYF
ncbi:MAG: hypothetical protein ABIN25_07355 [Ginsengibacter sp.]